MSHQPAPDFDGRIESVTVTAPTYPSALRAAAQAASLIENESCTVCGMTSEQDPAGKVILVLEFTKP